MMAAFEDVGSLSENPDEDEVPETPKECQTPKGCHHFRGRRVGILWDEAAVNLRLAEAADLDDASEAVFS